MVDSNLTNPVEATTSLQRNQQPRRKNFKIIVIGDSNVGKTCLTFRFSAGRCPKKSEATIGVDFREKVVEIDGERITLQLWDTAGQERFRNSLVHHYYRNADAVVFVYDITNFLSFESLPSWIKECDAQSLGAHVPRILVGNKCDCVDKIAVSTNTAQRFADQHSMPLFETSAADDDRSDHVDGIFMTLAHKLRNSKPMMSKQNIEVKLLNRQEEEEPEHGFCC